MEVVVLALVGAMAAGVSAVFLRQGLNRRPDPAIGAMHTLAIAFVTSMVVAAVVTRGGAGISWAAAWPFLALGVAVPGFTYLLLAQAVQCIGPSRTMVIVGLLPLLSSAAGIVFLDEPLRAPLALASVLIVASVYVLARDRARPENFRAIGVLWALGVVALFATRDAVSRWVLVLDRDVPGTAAAAALLAGATLAVFLFFMATRYRDAPVAQITVFVGPFVAAGIAFGVGQLTLLEAIDRGEITVISPLNGTAGLWAVVFAAVALRQSDAVSARLVVAAMLVVAAAAMIGITR